MSDSDDDDMKSRLQALSLGTDVLMYTEPQVPPVNCTPATALRYLLDMILLLASKTNRANQTPDSINSIANEILRFRKAFSQKVAELDAVYRLQKQDEEFVKKAKKLFTASEINHMLRGNNWFF